MGLFKEDIKIKISNSKYVIEKITLPKITKNKISLMVEPGYNLFVNNMTLKGQSESYELTAEDFGQKGNELEGFIYPQKYFDSISVKFFAGQHQISLSALPGSKAKFSIVGTVNVMIDDYKELARYFNRSITKEDLEQEVINNYRSSLGNEIETYAKKYITTTTNELDLTNSLDNIVSDVMTESRKTSSMLYQMGLIIKAKGISLHLNPVEGAEETINEINKKITEIKMDELDNAKREREERERDKERQHEIDLIVAKNTSRKEVKEDIHKTINQNEENKVSNKEVKKLFCEECGKEITSTTAKFCPHCGHPIKR